jgi:hypothetical protein
MPWTPEEQELLEDAEFLATKFESSRKGWTYSHSLGDLLSVRYRTDITGYNSLHRRLKRALNIRRLFGRSLFTKNMRPLQKLRFAFVRFREILRVPPNLPDGTMSNGVITHWEEDGRYIEFFGPTIGVEVLNFLKSEPDHPSARAIMDAMVHIQKLSAERAAGEPGIDSDSDDATTLKAR